MSVESFVHAAAELVVRIVSLRRDIVHCPMSVWECDREGLPEGSAYRAVYVVPLAGAEWWHFAVYRYNLCDPNDPERNIDVRLLGYSVEVWYRKRSQVRPRTAQASA